MKTAFNHNRTLLWVMIALLVLNTAIIGTIFIQRNTRFNRIPPAPMRNLFPDGTRPGLFMRRELNLNDVQFREFQQERFAFQQQAHRINIRLQQERRRFLNELMNNADSTELNTISDSMGALHAQLLNEAGKYYRNIRGICRKGQKSRLDSLFRDMIMSEEVNGIERRPPQGPGRRNPGGFFRRNRRNSYPF
jgi:hypothetical protein